MDNITAQKSTQDISSEKVDYKKLVDEVNKINKKINYILELIRTRNF
jgi:hypothetical protein